MMKKLSFWIILLIFTPTPQLLSANQAVVQGQIFAKSNHLPIPGLTVSLAHPNLGRSVRSITDGSGKFRFYGIPIMRTPYYIEVYWGNRIIFRSNILVNKSTVVMHPLYL